MSSPEKGKAKKNPARARRVVRKEKKSIQAKVTETTTEHSQFGGGCPNSGKYGHKATDCWYKQTNKSQGKGKGTEKSKSKLTEISETDSNKKVDDWCPSSNTSAQQPNLSQANAIGCTDETLDILAERQQETSVHGDLGRSV